MAYRSNKRSRNPLENDEPLNFNMDRMGCVYGPPDGALSHGQKSGLLPPPPPPLEPRSAGSGTAMSQLPPSVMYNGSGAMMDGSYPACYELDSSAPLLTSQPDPSAPVQYNFLPVGVQQPLYPKLPGTWMPDGTFLLQKEVIQCAGCVLYPPPPSARPPTTMERPPGCRTLFVGGLPENITPETVRSIFERCGEIEKMRCSNKNFAHVRFMLEVYVEHSLLLSGYRLLLEGAPEGAKPCRIHCDYAQARDDSYEYECHQRALQREIRHRQRQLEDFTRSPSPPAVCTYTSHEAQQLMKGIKEDGRFSEAAGVLVAWLDRGECNKRTVGNFYAMVQSTSLHVKRLISELTQIDQQLRAAKELSRNRQQELFLQFGSVERVFSAACRQKVWDHMSKAQRRNIQVWQKQATEAKTLYMTELCRGNDEMEMSDDEKMSDEPKTKKLKSSTKHKLEESGTEITAGGTGECEYEGEAEEESASSQLEVNRSWLQQLRKKHERELSNKQQQLDIVTATMHNVQKQLLLAKSHERSLEKQLATLKRSGWSAPDFDDYESEGSIVLVDSDNEIPSDSDPNVAECPDTAQDLVSDPDIPHHPDIDPDTAGRDDNDSDAKNNSDIVQCRETNGSGNDQEGNEASTLDAVEVQVGEKGSIVDSGEVQEGDEAPTLASEDGQKEEVSTFHEKDSNTAVPVSVEKEDSEVKHGAEGVFRVGGAQAKAASEVHPVMSSGGVEPEVHPVRASGGVEPEAHPVRASGGVEPEVHPVSASGGVESEASSVRASGGLASEAPSVSVSGGVAAEAASVKRHISVNKHRPSAVALSDARLIGLVSVFLSVYPAGASSSCVCSYLQQFVGLESIRPSRLNGSLAKYRNMFEARSSTNDDCTDYVWRFVAHGSIHPSKLRSSSLAAANFTRAGQ